MGGWVGGWVTDLGIGPQGRVGGWGDGLAGGVGRGEAVEGGELLDVACFWSGWVGGWVGGLNLLSLLDYSESTMLGGWVRRVEENEAV